MKRAWPGVRAFVVKRWDGEIQLKQVFCRDMLLVGTAVNVTAGASAALLASGASTTLAIAVFLVPLPYNFLLYMGVWLAAARAALAPAVAVRVVATLWLVATLVI